MLLGGVMIIHLITAGYLKITSYVAERRGVCYCFKSRQGKIHSLKVCQQGWLPH